MDKYRLFVDSFIMKLSVQKHGIDAVRASFQKSMDEGHVLVCSEASSIDNAVFRKDVDWFVKNAAKRNIIVEIYQGDAGDAASGIRAMINKKFEWSSYDGKTTEWTGEFEDLAHTMPDRQKLLKLYRAVLKFALPKGSWPMGPWKTANFFSAEQLAELGLDTKQAGNRSLVFESMKQHGYSMDTYIAYTKEYLGGLVSQHNCDSIALLDLL